MLLLYNLLSAITLLIYLPFILFKKGPADRVRFITERLGISRYERTDIWVHAVSVGEVIACMPFLKKLKREFPGKRILLSTTTYTGQKVARERFNNADKIMYMPWDTGLCIKRVVSSLKPEIFITVETELWPVLFRTLKRSGSKIIILNGRISNRSFSGYARLGFLMKHVLSHVDFFYMQGDHDADRIMKIGAERLKVGIMGNFKFDITFDPSNNPAWLEGIKGRVLLAASTHKGEEDILLDAFELTRKSFPDLKLIIAPRHPERFHEVEEILKQRASKYMRKTQLSSLNAAMLRNNGDPAPSIKEEWQYPADILLLDTIGELSQVFSKVTIAFIGGSLVPIGGHNILEPAFWAKPTIFGPHMDNFPFAADFLVNSAAVQVKDAHDIFSVVTELLNNSIMAERMGQNAKILVEKNTGAIEKAIGLVRGLLGNS